MKRVTSPRGRLQLGWVDGALDCSSDKASTSSSKNRYQPGSTGPPDRGVLTWRHERSRPTARPVRWQDGVCLPNVGAWCEPA